MPACERCWSEYKSRLLSGEDVEYADVVSQREREHGSCSSVEQCGDMHLICVKDGHGSRCRCGHLRQPMVDSPRDDGPGSRSGPSSAHGPRTPSSGSADHGDTQPPSPCILVGLDGSRQEFDSLPEAYEAASDGDTIYADYIFNDGVHLNAAPD